nr:cobaltochelatase subunit CobN [uncultured Porphyromonas sp.]
MSDKKRPSPRRKCMIIGLIIALILAVGSYFVWGHYGATTRIALVNFPGYLSSGIILSNENAHVKYDELKQEDIDRFGSYDCVLTFGMGLKWNEQQRAEIKKKGKKGLQLLVLYATTEENEINTLGDRHAQRINEYMGSGNKKNYRSLANYIRKYVDGKSWFAPKPDSVADSSTEVYYHIDEEVAFEKLADYEAYMKKKGFYHEGAKKVLMIGGLNDPFSGNKQNLDSIIMSLHRSGLNVYPVTSFTDRLRFLQEVSPDLVIHFPHGRISMTGGDAVVEYLRERNIPVIAPLTLMASQKDWEEDAQGMMGGFLSQTIGMPELDGAVYPYVVTTQEENRQGLYMLRAIPDRLEKLTRLVHSFLNLKTKPNRDKKLAIYYFKGPGQEALAAQGLEVVPSLYNLLRRLKSEGYNLTGLPEDVKAFERQIMTEGPVIQSVAGGQMEEYLAHGHPAWVKKSELEQWIQQDLTPKQIKEIKETYGDVPGQYMTRMVGGIPELATTRIQYGNVVLLPQPVAGIGSDNFAIVHGAASPPPYPYVCAYLWARHAFQADAIMHFGTHGSLEFTPQKQVALSNHDWGDALIAPLPHFYYYTIGNVGESMMAKRRSYASLISYITPPFDESKTRHTFTALQEAIEKYYELKDPTAKDRQSLEVKKHTVGLGLHRELRLDSILTQPYSAKDVERIDNFAEEIASEKVNGTLYTTGEAYTPAKVTSTVVAMSADPIAYAKARLDRLRSAKQMDNTSNKHRFYQQYLQPAQQLVLRVLSSQSLSPSLVLSYGGITQAELDQAHKINPPKGRGGMKAAMMASQQGKPTDGKPSSAPKDPSAKNPMGMGKAISQGNAQGKPTGQAKDSISNEPSKQERDKAEAITDLERAILAILTNHRAITESPRLELDATINALNGGFTAPSPGGDAVANPQAVPTGRNLYSVRAESTPSQRAWSQGVQLAQATLKAYKEQHGKYPTKVSYTFWSSEFVETEGVTIAQVLYMLGVEPVRTQFGSVEDVRLIPTSELGRPRIDVVIQTSGQFRDLAASRLALITKAVELVASQGKESEENYVAQGSINTEKELVEQGLSPKEARALANVRIFGGINGMYGTGIQEMVTAGDKWDQEKEIADVYLNNMGAAYTGKKEDWGRFVKPLFRAALKNTDVVIQPRQNNTWGALSLDHVYEFMGGLTLSVRNVTGKDPDTYLADYRNHSHMRMQDLKEAIGIESRATVLNPEYVKEALAGGASSVANITEVVTNTYGWNVMKPEVIDKELWDNLYDMYIRDVHGLGVTQAFEGKSPAALEELTAVMLETARKGMWQASPEQLSTLAARHTELVAKYGPSGGGMTMENHKLRDFIAQNVSPETAKQYKGSMQYLDQGSDANASTQDGVVMKRETVSDSTGSVTKSFSGLYVVAGVAVLFVILLIILRVKRRRDAE